jgi:hypothetical protein
MPLSRHLVGDTLIATGRINGSLPKIALSPDLRISEVRPGEGFGRVTAIAATPDGGVLVFDANGPDGAALLQFGPSGAFVRQIGRSGDGPGEYRAPQFGHQELVLGPRGVIALRNSGRVELYGSDGSPRGRVSYGSTLGPTWTSGDTRYLDADHLFLRGSTIDAWGTPNVMDFPFHLFTPSGRGGDSVLPPHLYGVKASGMFGTGEIWTILNQDEILVARTDSLSYTIVRKTGAPKFFRVELPYSPVRYDSKEREELQASLDWQRAHQMGPKWLSTAQVVPSTKPVLKPQVLIDGKNFWLRLSAAGEHSTPIPGGIQVGRDGKREVGPSITFSEPLAFFGFTWEGEVRGLVQFPLSVTAVSFAGSTAWAVTKVNEEDVLVRYQLH